MWYRVYLDNIVLSTALQKQLRSQILTGELEVHQNQGHMKIRTRERKGVQEICLIGTKQEGQLAQKKRDRKSRQTEGVGGVP